MTSLHWKTEVFNKEIEFSSFPRPSSEKVFDFTKLCFLEEDARRFFALRNLYAEPNNSRKPSANYKRLIVFAVGLGTIDE